MFLTSPGVPLSCSSVWIIPVPVIIAGATSLNVIPLLPILLAKFFERPWTPALRGGQRLGKRSDKKGHTFRCAIVATIDTRATRSNRRDIYNSPPSLLKHVWHSKLRNNKRASQIDVDRIIPLLDVDLENVAHALAIACIHDEDIGMLAMLLFDFVEKPLQVAFFADITLVRGDCPACCLRGDFRD
jgi:hypothetical protein